MVLFSISGAYTFLWSSGPNTAFANCSLLSKVERDVEMPIYSHAKNLPTLKKSHARCMFRDTESFLTEKTTGIGTFATTLVLFSDLSGHVYTMLALVHPTHLRVVCEPTISKRSRRHFFLRQTTVLTPTPKLWNNDSKQSREVPTIYSRGAC